MEEKQFCQRRGAAPQGGWRRASGLRLGPEQTIREVQSWWSSYPLTIQHSPFTVRDYWFRPSGSASGLPPRPSRRVIRMIIRKIDWFSFIFHFVPARQFVCLPLRGATLRSNRQIFCPGVFVDSHGPQWNGPIEEVRHEICGWNIKILTNISNFHVYFVRNPILKGVSKRRFHEISNGATFKPSCF